VIEEEGVCAGVGDPGGENAAEKFACCCKPRERGTFWVMDDYIRVISNQFFIVRKKNSQGG
jgi:hypothetical protein